MNTSRFARLALAPALLLLLAGCAGMGGAGHRHDAAGGRHEGMGAQGRMDREKMCEMHRQSMAGRTAAEREAMMEERMRSMTPEMRRQMQEMMQDCR